MQLEPFIPEILMLPWLDAAAIIDGPVFRRVWLRRRASPDAPSPAREFGDHRCLKRGGFSTGAAAGAFAA